MDACISVADLVSRGKSELRRLERKELKLPQWTRWLSRFPVAVIELPLNWSLNKQLPKLVDQAVRMSGLAAEIERDQLDDLLDEDLTFVEQLNGYTAALISLQASTRELASIAGGFSKLAGTLQRLEGAVRLARSKAEELRWAVLEHDAEVCSRKSAPTRLVAHSQAELEKLFDLL
ncbi:hypothetical protein [Derxia gummosa]|uniref:Uncharacterized protein n=1 Tax=Derxia gummosa DSM 723 TaxID=1121388 RepID=A0A8B6XCF4_9BURK|nr:hypothetical protein [Derxia gummosa]